MYDFLISNTFIKLYSSFRGNIHNSKKLNNRHFKRRNTFMFFLFEKKKEKRRIIHVLRVVKSGVWNVPTFSKLQQFSELSSDLLRLKLTLKSDVHVLDMTFVKFTQFGLWRGSVCCRDLSNSHRNYSGISVTGEYVFSLDNMGRVQINWTRDLDTNHFYRFSDSPLC